MTEKRSPKSSDKHTSQTQNPSSGCELQLPLSCVDHLLQEEQYRQSLTSSKTDFLLAVLDCLADYILEMVGSEASNDTMNINSEDGERKVDNSEANHILKDVSFSLFDEMPGARKTG
ncbi:huntingtin-interacting protein M [Microcebus murinus]|uniref:huntingtin-interacting protein M n=1 Tax=Microcebus murinus TaxID=30608 RepID=UPI00064296A9|nr:huntingtin-interacting protein M [Microcebus murinus]